MLNEVDQINDASVSNSTPPTESFTASFSIQLQEIQPNAIAPLRRSSATSHQLQRDQTTLKVNVQQLLNVTSQLVMFVIFCIIESFRGYYHMSYGRACVMCREMIIGLKNIKVSERALSHEALKVSLQGSSVDTETLN